MWWECTQCPAGGNSPTEKDKHTQTTGHFAKLTYDTKIEDE